MENKEQELVTGVVVSELENYYESRKAIAYITAAISGGCILGFTIAYYLIAALCRIL